MYLKIRPKIKVAEKTPPAKEETPDSVEFKSVKEMSGPPPLALT